MSQPLRPESVLDRGSRGCRKEGKQCQHGETVVHKGEGDEVGEVGCSLRPLWAGTETGQVGEWGAIS